MRRTIDIFGGEHGRPELVEALHMLHPHDPNGPVGPPDYGRHTLPSKDFLGLLRYYTALEYI